MKRGFSGVQQSDEILLVQEIAVEFVFVFFRQQKKTEDKFNLNTQSMGGSYLCYLLGSR